MDDNQNLPPEWDAEFAENLIGAFVLIGVRRIKSTGETEMTQFAGTVVSAAESDTIHVQLRDGSDWSMPPALHWFEPAAPGVYRLRSTGKEIENPDYLVQIAVEEPSN
ncbi:MAG: hypothetical protein QNI84_00160 [Henriciella sp.]|nr:hypothetical protein [Henriciella sp.]